MSYLKSAAIGAATGLAVFAITATIMVAPVRAAQPDELTRALGYQLLQWEMLDQIEKQRAVDWTPPGYFMVGYTVRVG